MTEEKLISAEGLIRALRDDIGINGTNFAKVKRHIENAPAVEVVQSDCYWATEQAYKNGYAKGYADGKADGVVRCEDCKWWKYETCKNGFGLAFNGEDDFCSYGERREGE